MHCLQKESRLVTSECSGVDLAMQGTTPSAHGRNQALQTKLHEDWSKNRPGGHDLVWDGNGQGTIQRRLCTRKWPYDFKNWKKQILVACHGGPAMEHDRRRNLKAQIDSFTSQHSLTIDVDTDYVTCQVCRARNTPRNGNLCPKNLPWQGFRYG